MNTNKDTLGDRCKRYEAVAEHYFVPKIPIVVRVDGKAFHTWTRGCARPFDQNLINTMFNAAKAVANAMQGIVGCYVQSDEATFVLTDDTQITTQQWFVGRQNKIESIAAATMTAYFNAHWRNVAPNSTRLPAVFDARAFQVPKEDVANVLLWRVKDWERNSLSMFCEKFFSNKQLHGKGRAARHEMLHKIGHNWATECTDQQKNGSWWSPILGESFSLHNYEQINEFLFGYDRN